MQMKGFHSFAISNYVHQSSVFSFPRKIKLHFVKFEVNTTFHKENFSKTLYRVIKNVDGQWLKGSIKMCLGT